MDIIKKYGCLIEKYKDAGIFLPKTEVDFEFVAETYDKEEHRYYRDTCI
ncbi:hypothetical protein [Bacillus rhizoplanae]